MAGRDREYLRSNEPWILKYFVCAPKISTTRLENSGHVGSIIEAMATSSKRNPDLDSSSRRNRVLDGPTVIYRLLKRSREREGVGPLFVG